MEDIIGKNKEPYYVGQTNGRDFQYNGSGFDFNGISFSTNFSPTVNVTLSNTMCDSLATLNLTVNYSSSSCF